MRIETTRFGTIDVPEERVISFPRGLIGFPHTTRYVLLDHPGGGPFRWLQSADAPAVAFAVTDPRLFFEDYRVPVSREDLQAIGLEDAAEAAVVVILVVPKDPESITANLLGPVVINARDRIAAQIVLESGTYTTRHRIFERGAAAPC
ncbi:MAG: flagellar assembly protein FliW [Planctomycetes bacterium]|nr:flagellar assembly protein FliW [Planctomycetota bacterium]